MFVDITRHAHRSQHKPIDKFKSGVMGEDGITEEDDR